MWRPAAPPWWAAALVVAAVAVVWRLAFSLRAPPFVTNDSLSYLLPGFDLAHGLGFDPALKRPPGYPLFIAGAMALGGEELRSVMLLQHLLGAATAVMAMALGWTLFGRVAGAIAGLATALSGPLVVMEHYVMSETLFTVFLVLAVLLYARLLEGGRGWLAVSVGLAIGLAALTRPIGQSVAVLLALGLLAPRGPSLGQRARQAGLLLAGCALVVLPWMVRNLAVHGTFALATGLGEGLAVRTIRYEQRFDVPEAPEGDRQAARARRIYREEARDGSAFDLARRFRDELSLSEAAADRAMRDVALAAIWTRPDYYVAGSLDMAWRTFAGRPVRLRQDWQPWRNINWPPRVARLLPQPSPVEDRQFGQAEWLATAFDPARFPWAMLALAAAGTVAGLWRGRLLVGVLAVLVTVLVLVGGFLIGIEWRYRYPLDPLINVLAAGGAAAIVSRVPALATRLRPPQPSRA
ncbi:MAG: glycosyltransferase family 39 protein [Chloroflexota bacterium]